MWLLSDVSLELNSGSVLCRRAGLFSPPSSILALPHSRGPVSTFDVALTVHSNNNPPPPRAILTSLGKIRGRMREAESLPDGDVLFPELLPVVVENMGEALGPQADPNGAESVSGVVFSPG